MQVPSKGIYHHAVMFVLCSGFEPLCVGCGESADLFPMKTQHINRDNVAASPLRNHKPSQREKKQGTHCEVKGGYVKGCK